MGDRQRLIAQLVLHEGRRQFPYVDTVDKITIGVGRNLSDRGLSDAEIDYLLENDMNECITDLSVAFPWFAGLDPVRQRVLVDMRFNLGHTRFRGFKSMLKALEVGNYSRACQSMRESLWARQVKSRADRLIAMMRTGVDYTA